MLFPSEIFLFVFLPVVLILYFGIFRRYNMAKNVFLQPLILCIWRANLCLSYAAYDICSLFFWNSSGGISRQLRKDKAYPVCHGSF